MIVVGLFLYGWPNSNLDQGLAACGVSAGRALKVSSFSLGIGHLHSVRLSSISKVKDWESS